MSDYPKMLYMSSGLQVIVASAAEEAAWCHPPQTADLPEEPVASVPVPEDHWSESAIDGVDRSDARVRGAWPQTEPKNPDKHKKPKKS